MSESSGASATWTLSGFGDEIHSDPIVQIAVLQALGASHIEVRGAWDTNILTMSDEQVDRFATILADRTMGVSAIASPIGKIDVSLPVEHEVDRLRRAIEVGRRLGTRNVRLFSFYRSEGISAESIRDDVLTRMSALADLAARHDVMLLHENEKDIYGDTPERVLDIIESVGSDHLRLAWDSANFVQIGVQPFRDGFATLAPYIDYLHVKDARVATGEVTPVGEGDGEFRPTVEALVRSGFSGFASLEPHLSSAGQMGGFSGPLAFGVAARAFRRIAEEAGVSLI
ncbi:MAG: sugar phosphate isomerase/epimerase family protein [Thermomicrobiales bacterium]